MKSINHLYSSFLFLFLVLGLVIAGCGGGGSGGNSSSNPANNSASKTLVSITISPANHTMSIGTTQQFSATGVYSDNSTHDLTSSATWTSSNPVVATISTVSGSLGLVTGVSAGATTVTATSGGISGSTPLTVTAETLVSMVITPANPFVAPGSTQQFTVNGTYSDNATHDLTAAATWISSNAGVATISNAAGSNGRASAISSGPTTITSTSGGVTASTTLTVSAATLVSLVVTPVNPSVALGATQQFVATGMYSDTSTQNLTGSVSWVSQNTAVVGISNAAGSAGMATPAAAGTTTITATLGGVTGSTGITVTAASSQPANVMQVTVNGSLCSTGSYINKPCVSVTICSPSGSNCQAVNDILLDTGSSGLRIFKQALTAPLTQVSSGSGALAECITFGDGSSEWGPVETASVVLGGEPAIQVPLHVVDSTFGTRPGACQNADASPTDAGFNGILGVGLVAQDCGSMCVSSANNTLYYSCSGSSCSPSTAPLASQVTNPVALLPVDNNGVLVQILSVPLGGVPSVNGNLILGIGTQSNNGPAAATAYPANYSNDFNTNFNGRSYSNAFIDSGSNGYFFQDKQLTVCTGGNSGFFCPASVTSLTATISGTSGTPTATVPFKIGNFATLISTNNSVFVEAGGSGFGGFDWGLPFFFGRNVFVQYRI